MISLALRCASTYQIRNELKKTALNRYAKRRTCASLRFSHSSETEQGERRVLVYAAPLRTRIRVTKLLSLSSSVFALTMAPHALGEIAAVSVPLAVGAGVVSSAFLSTPLLLNWMTRRYVLSLHFDPSSRIFTASTFDLLTREVNLQFSAEEVEVPDLPGFLSSFEVHKRPLFVDSRMVKDVDAYAHMMGYDKPLDMHVDPKKS